MKYLILVTLLTLSNWSKAQIASNKFMVYGKTSKGIFGSKTIGDYCLIKSEKYIPRETKVFISGVKECKRGEYTTIKLFEIIHENQSYYTDTSGISLSNVNQWDLINAMTPDEVDSLKTNAEKASLRDVEFKRAHEEEEQKERRRDTLAVVAFLEKTKPLGLTILNFSCYDESEYTEGTGVNVRIYNPSNKTIKYVWFNFYGYNAVGDRVSSKGKFMMTTRGIGPIEPREEGAYEYEYVWFTDIVEKVKLASIKLQYMDGTFKLISNPAAITLPGRLYSIIDSED